ncbi:MAG: S26 family signal peptidase [Robiginitomaculum sp.]|nr:S26 family signal peptidase [Robiginitomaculum sp.]
MFEVGSKCNSARLAIVFMLIGNGLLVASFFDLGPAKLVWNASESVTKGLYRITVSPPKADELVFVQLPEWAAFLASQHRYLPKNVPALKRIFDVSGDVVCRFGSNIFVNQNRVAIAKIQDGFGRMLPQWSGCRVLKSYELFLLADHPDSFDGRYFGIGKASSVIGIAVPVWLVSE